MVQYLLGPRGGEVGSQPTSPMGRYGTNRLASLKLKSFFQSLPRMQIQIPVLSQSTKQASTQIIEIFSCSKNKMLNATTLFISLIFSNKKIEKNIVLVHSNNHV